jgi:uncharacterized protein (TIGR02145 family)
MKKVAIITMLLAILFSCKKNDINVNPNPPLTGNTLSSNAFIVDTPAISGVTDLSVRLLKTKTLLRPQVGDILLAAPTVSNTLGFLRKVLSVTESASEITCYTEQSNLNDAFSQLNFSMNYLDTFSSNAILTSGETGSKLGITFKDYAGPDDGHYGHIIINGELYFNIPSVKIEYTKKGGSLLPEKVLLQAEFNTDGSSLEILNQEFSYFFETVLNVFDLPAIKVSIPVTTQSGVITIPIPFTQQLIIKAFPVTMEAGYSKWKIRPDCSATLGIKFENSTWTNLNRYAIEASADSFVQDDFGPPPYYYVVENGTIAKPEYRIYPFGNENLGAFFEIPMTFDFRMQVTNSPNYSLNFIMDVTGGAAQTFYTGIPQEYSMPGNVFGKTILEGDWPYYDPRDGKVYPYVKIGTQTWMTKNLEYIGFPGRFWGDAYGVLYSWSALQYACPPGWHIPSDDEWAILINYLGGDSVAGGKLKATTGWNAPNTGATNSSGFSGFPGGFHMGSGDNDTRGWRGFWWTSTMSDVWGNIWVRELKSESAAVGRITGYYTEGYSVRCIKD